MQRGSAPGDPSLEHPVATLEQAVARMVTLDAEFPLGDGVRYFNTLYLEVTREVVRRLSAGELEDPGFLEQLAVFFSNAYLRAVADFAQEPGSGASRAWAPL